MTKVVSSSFGSILRDLLEECERDIGVRRTYSLYAQAVWRAADTRLFIGLLHALSRWTRRSQTCKFTSLIEPVTISPLVVTFRRQHQSPLDAVWVGPCIDSDYG